MARKRTAFADDIPKARRECRFPHGCDPTETRLWPQLFLAYVLLGSRIYQSTRRSWARIGECASISGTS
jgi:hypothetical protein